MIQYDPDVIIEKAQGLIRQGLEVQIVGTINHVAGGLILGLIAGFTLALLPSSSVWREIERHLSQLAASADYEA